MSEKSQPFSRTSFWQKASMKKDGCWEWKASKFKTGYGAVRIAGKTKYAHRHSYEITNGAIPEGLCVLHTCDNRKCINPEHLFLGTRKDNAFDMIEKGRWRTGDKSGEKNGSAKLTQKEVLEIRKLYASGNFSQRELAKRFSVSQVQIGNITRGKHWSDV